MIGVRCPSCSEWLSAPQCKPNGTADCPKCGQVVTLPVEASQAETVAAPPVPPDPNRTHTFGGEGKSGSVPTRIAIAGYEVLEEVGRGGMGVVYKARQLNPPRLVALKMILSGEHAAPDQLARFRAEAEATARLTHPAIVQIHQVGEWHSSDGGLPVPYLTLEYVEGHTLSRRLEQDRQVAPRQAAELVRQLARGVHYAHQQGIVHRDLKPSNVLLTGQEGPDTLGEPKIVDFGLAKPLDGFGSIVSGPQTQSGAVLGTPSYMAPEQARGKGKVGPPADVYALGAILYELLTGRPPFVGESTVETLIRVTKEEPLPPRSLQPKVPRDLETICLSCLAKDPERRYPSAAALAQDLGRFLEGESVHVRPPSKLEQLGRYARRRKELLYLAAGATVAAAIVVGVVLARQTPSGTTQTPPPDTTPPDSSLPVDDNPIAESRRRMTSANNLKQIVIALHNINSVYDEFPPPAIYDKAGRPLLSWRVAILPYIEQENLYKQFKLEEPWDSPQNKALIDKMPAQYMVEGVANPPHTTHYQAIVGKNTAWEVFPELRGTFGRRGMRFTDMTDGTSNTILVAEVAKPVIWTQPEDAVFDGDKLPQFGGVVKNGFNVGMGDGSVLFVHNNVLNTHLKAALTRNGGETLPSNWEFGPSPPPEPSRGATAKSGKAIDNVPKPSPRSEEPVEVVQVSGKVTYKGKPVPGGHVMFHDKGTQNRTFAVNLESNGDYTNALPPGTYTISIMSPRDATNFPAIPKQYTDPKTSGLSIELKSGTQTHNIVLTDASPSPPVPPKK